MRRTETLSADTHDFLKALANATRQRILLHLLQVGEEVAVGKLARELKVGLSTVSEHLTALRRVGLVRSERRANEVFYSAEKTKLVSHLNVLMEMLTCC